MNVKKENHKYVSHENYEQMFFRTPQPKVLIPMNVKKENHKYVSHENYEQMFFRTPHHTSSESNSNHQY